MHLLSILTGYLIEIWMVPAGLSMVAIYCTKNGRLKVGHQGDGLEGSPKI